MGCQYTPAVLNLGTNRFPIRQFPVVPNEGAMPRLGALRQPATRCVGQEVVFSLSGPTLGTVGDTLDWSFGDGTTLRTSSPQATHSYPAAGTYTLVVHLRNRPYGPIEQLTASLSVVLRPTLNLGPDILLCAGTTAQLATGAVAAGTTIRWNDGSTAATHSVTASGIYWAELTSAGGCSVRDSVVAKALAAPVVALTTSQSLCAGGQVLLSTGTQPAGTRYRWQDGSTGSSFTASAPGTFTVKVTSSSGCETQAT
jgi:hypothetical protein